MATYTIKSLKLGVNRMTVSSSGNVSIGGGFQPNQKLEINKPEPEKKEITDTMVDIYLGK